MSNREIKETCYKGTRILLGNEKRIIINTMISYLVDNGYTEISIPVIQYQETFKGKVGAENNNLMFNFTDNGGLTEFKDRGNRDICLAPEYTAVVQKLSNTIFKFQKDVKLFYVQECFRGEKPQEGRYRQFTQLGVEIVNPSQDYITELKGLAYSLIKEVQTDIHIMSNVNRGLDYYKNGRGFEIICDSLGSSKQICGGGEYDGGIGFAIGIDRLILKTT